MANLNSRELLKRVEGGDSRAAAAIFDRYVARLVALARGRIGPKLRRRIDAEDVVQSAYRSFFVHAENHEFAVNEAGDLWRLLARITLNKLYGQVEKHTAARRSIRREDLADDLTPETPAPEPTAAEVIALTEQLRIAIAGLSSTEQAVLGALARRFDRRNRRGNPEVAAYRPPASGGNAAEARKTVNSRQWENGKHSRSASYHGPDSRAPLSYSDFRLERLLGAGGMGKVYRATQLSTGRHVAIKALLKSRQADANSIEKFLQEAQILGSLKHPNIVGFHGVGRFPGGGYFIAMDFVDGTDLQSRISQMPLSADDAIRVVRIVAHAIAHAHERGVVHGDIKPANILADRAHCVVVTDFGLAQFVGATSRTPPWLVGGTAGYIAPEVGHHGCMPEPASDIYGLGALLWSLATGSVPSDKDVLCHNDPRTRRLFSLCGNCLAPDPKQRFQSVAEFLEAMARTSAEIDPCDS